MLMKLYQHIDIDAPPDTVWNILTNRNTWPIWFPDLEEVTGGAVEVGGTSRRRSGEAGAGTIVSVEPTSNSLKVVTQRDESQVTHSFDVVRSGGSLGMCDDITGLRYTLEYEPSGGFLGDFVAGSDFKDFVKTKQTLEKLKNLAESRVESRSYDRG